MKLQFEAPGRLPQIACFRLGICPWVDEMRYVGRFGNQLVQQLQPLRAKLRIQSRYASDVCTRSVQACYKSNLDWIAPNFEDDRSSRDRFRLIWLGPLPLSALGQKRTYAAQKGMSALPSKADMCSALGDVRFVPKADIERRERFVKGCRDERIARRAE